MNKIEVPLSRKHIAGLFLRAVGFILIGVLFATNPDWFAFHRLDNLELIRIVGVFSIVFFSIILVYDFYRVWGKRVGLIIDKNGIADYTTSSGVNFIHWEDIVEVKKEQLDATEFLLVYISNPEYYLEHGKWGKRNIMKWNFKTYGTPLCISADLLQCNPTELQMILAKRLKDSAADKLWKEEQVKAINWQQRQVVKSVFGYN